MSIAYFDDEAKLYIRCGGGDAVRSVFFVKADHIRGAEKDTVTLYIPLYRVRDIKFVEPSAWDETHPPLDGFTLRPNDRFSYHNTGRRGSETLGESAVFTVKTVAFYTRGSMRMRHIKAYAEAENAEITPKTA